VSTTVRFGWGWAKLLKRVLEGGVRVLDLERLRRYRCG